MMYLLDTTVVSELRKPDPDPHVLAWYSTVTSAEIFIRALTIGRDPAGNRTAAPHRRRQGRTPWSRGSAACTQGYGDHIIDGGRRGHRGMGSPPPAETPAPRATSARDAFGRVDRFAAVPAVHRRKSPGRATAGRASRWTARLNARTASRPAASRVRPNRPGQGRQPPRYPGGPSRVSICDRRRRQRVHQRMPRRSAALPATGTVKSAMTSVGGLVVQRPNQLGAQPLEQRQVRGELRVQTDLDDCPRARAGLTMAAMAASAPANKATPVSPAAAISRPAPGVEMTRTSKSSASRRPRPRIGCRCPLIGGATRSIRARLTRQIPTGHSHQRQRPGRRPRLPASRGSSGDDTGPGGSGTAARRPRDPGRSGRAQTPPRGTPGGFSATAPYAKT